jgi:hypothetical protein
MQRNSLSDAEGLLPGGVRDGVREPEVKEPELKTLNRISSLKPLMLREGNNHRPKKSCPPQPNPLPDGEREHS